MEEVIYKNGKEVKRRQLKPAPVVTEKRKSTQQLIKEIAEKLEIPLDESD